jgi:hypothetical protein
MNVSKPNKGFTSPSRLSRSLNCCEAQTLTTPTTTSSTSSMNYRLLGALQAQTKKLHYRLLGALQVQTKKLQQHYWLLGALLVQTTKLHQMREAYVWHQPSPLAAFAVRRQAQVRSLRSHLKKDR